MAKQCPVGVSVLCAVTDPECQSYGQPYTTLSTSHPTLQLERHPRASQQLDMWTRDNTAINRSAVYIATCFDCITTFFSRNLNKLFPLTLYPGIEWSCLTTCPQCTYFHTSKQIIPSDSMSRDQMNLIDYVVWLLIALTCRIHHHTQYWDTYRHCTIIISSPIIPYSSLHYTGLIITTPTRYRRTHSHIQALHRHYSLRSPRHITAEAALFHCMDANGLVTRTPRPRLRDIGL
jgi:hypothetical protein